MAEDTDCECPHPSLGACGTPTPYVGPPCVLGTWGGRVGAHWGPPVLSSMTSPVVEPWQSGPGCECYDGRGGRHGGQGVQSTSGRA